MSHPINPRYFAAGKHAADQMMQAAFGPPPTEPPPPPPLTVGSWTTGDTPTAIKIEPGQRILLVFAEHTTQAVAAKAVDAMRASYPDIGITAIGGVAAVLVLPAKLE